MVNFHKTSNKDLCSSQLGNRKRTYHNALLLKEQSLRKERGESAVGFTPGAHRGRSETRRRDEEGAINTLLRNARVG
jgi:hypothetical protein